MRKLNFAMDGVAWIASVVISRASTPTPLTVFAAAFVVAMSPIPRFYVSNRVHSMYSKYRQWSVDTRWHICHCRYVIRPYAQESHSAKGGPMIDVAVLFLNETFSSTAVGPMEVFRHAGSLWNVLTGVRMAPRFRVTTASADGKAVGCDGPIQIQPMAAINEIRKADLIF